MVFTHRMGRSVSRALMLSVVVVMAAVSARCDGASVGVGLSVGYPYGPYGPAGPWGPGPVWIGGPVIR